MERPANPFDRPPGDDERGPFATGEHTSFDGDDDAAFYALDGELDEALDESPEVISVDPPVEAPATSPFDSGPVTAPALGGTGGSVRGPATIAAPAALALMEHDDDEPVGLFARTSFAPGAGPRVSLMPAEVLTTRRVRHAQHRGVLALVAVVVLVVAAYALVSGERSIARQDLAAAQQRSADLTAQQARYARAPVVYAQVADTSAALSSVMAQDVRWYDYLSNLAVTAPTGLWLTSWKATVADPAAASATPAVDPTTGLPFTANTQATLSFSATTSDEADVVSWLRLLTATPGLAGSGATALTRTAVGDQPVITFDSSASMTDAALSRRYPAKKD